MKSIDKKKDKQIRRLRIINFILTAYVILSVIIYTYNHFYAKV